MRKAHDQSRPSAHRVGMSLRLETHPSPPLITLQELPFAARLSSDLHDSSDPLSGTREHVDATSDYMELLTRLWSSGRVNPSQEDEEIAKREAFNHASDLASAMRNMRVDKAAPPELRPWDTARIAEVAFFGAGFVRAWYFSALDGTLRRKGRQKTSCADLLSSFVKHSNSKSGGVTAVAVFQPKHSDKASMIPLDSPTLNWLLDNEGDALRRREPLRALLRYKKPRGECDAVLRFDWREKVSDWEMRRSRVPLACLAPLWLKLTTHGPAMAFSERERYVPAAALAVCKETCRQLAFRVGNRERQGSLRVVADFRLMGGDKVELMWATLPNSDDSIPTAHLPSSMPYAELKRTFEAHSEPPGVSELLGSSQGTRRRSLIPPCESSHESKAQLNFSRFFVCSGCGK